MNSLSSLIGCLRKASFKPFSRIGNIVSSYKGHDWEYYRQVSEENYNRCRIYTDDVYDIYVITWGSKQKSPIHDHPEGGCWLKVLEGSLREIIYDKNMLVKTVRYLKPGDLGFMHNSFGYHKIENNSNRVATTLHVYSPPKEKSKL